jgi:hypothetical protein
VGKEAGGAAVGELPEGEMDLRLEACEGGGIAGQLLGPGPLVLDEGGLDVLEGLLQRRDRLAVLGPSVELHGRTRKSATARGPYPIEEVPRRHFLGMHPLALYKRLLGASLLLLVILTFLTLQRVKGQSYEPKKCCTDLKVGGRPDGSDCYGDPMQPCTQGTNCPFAVRTDTVP